MQGGLPFATLVTKDLTVNEANLETTKETIARYDFEDVQNINRLQSSPSALDSTTKIASLSKKMLTAANATPSSTTAPMAASPL
jgi:hypothetical protein